MSLLRRLGKLSPTEKMILQELYQNHKTTLYKTVYKIVKDEKITEDIVHTAFIKISDKLNELDDITELKKYITTIAKNEAINHYKFNNRFYKSDKIDELNSNTDSSAIPEDVLEKKENIQTLNNHLKNSPEKFKTIIYYRDIKELPFKEISKILNKKEGTLRSHYSRAIKHLKRKLKKAGDFIE